MADLTKLQEELLEEAANRMRNQPWFCGVCMDHLPTDIEIKYRRKACLESLIDETMYWDAPVRLSQDP
jgi:hypothetical protein